MIVVFSGIHSLWGSSAQQGCIIKITGWNNFIWRAYMKKFKYFIVLIVCCQTIVLIQ